MYTQKANPNATNSELDAKVIIYPKVKVELEEWEIGIIIDALQKERTSYSFNKPNEPKIKSIEQTLALALAHHEIAILKNSK
tara:strand:+ start:51 stop:296 length:246 start_codon:yes stop_codon:yes gene_type:complete